MILSVAIFLFSFFFQDFGYSQETSTSILEVYPAPAGITASPQYSAQVSQDGKTANPFVYQTQNPAFLMNGQSSGISTSSTLEKSTAWMNFSFSGDTVTIQITNKQAFTNARVLPSHWQISPTTQGFLNCPLQSRATKYSPNFPKGCRFNRSGTSTATAQRICYYATRARGAVRFGK